MDKNTETAPSATPQGEPPARPAESEAQTTTAACMFEQLRAAGYDLVKVGYDADTVEVYITGMMFSQGGEKVEDAGLEHDVRAVLKDYLYETLPVSWGATGCWGVVRLYPASSYAVFENTQRYEEDERFSSGVPGPEVPADDR